MLGVPTEKMVKHIAKSVILMALLSAAGNDASHRKTRYPYDGGRSTAVATKIMCVDWSNTIRARHKSCFLRPDTGPCRADILQWYYDAKQKKCYRFFWGGCQGNGNRFETKKECTQYCFLNVSALDVQIPSFCTLSFDFGTCYGQYYRWTWDNISKSCKRRLYSGCGGNQNNFETYDECVNTCIKPPANTLNRLKDNYRTTCIPFDLNNLN